MEFLFTLGFAEDLAVLELESVLGVRPPKIGDHLYKVSLSDPGRANYLANRLGGLIEIKTEDGRVFWRHSAKAWHKRDRLKPFSDPHKGLLPPKIARILINLALGQSDPEGKTILDPFCGSGTILMEGHVIGLKLIGLDQDQHQLSGARRNLTWLGAKADLYQADATQASKTLKEKVDLIVTEPFMGRPGTREDRLPDLTKGLKKLYLGCLKDWVEVIKPGGRIVMVFPVFSYHGRDYSTTSVIDEPRLLNYNIRTRGLIYSRPEARVRREIVVLERK